MSNWKSVLYADHTGLPINSHCYEAFVGRDTPCKPCHALDIFDDGKPILIEYYNQHTKLFKEVSAYPIFDDNNHVTMVAEHVRDITDRKQAEEEKKASEEKYRDIVENAVEGIFQTTPEGQYITVNPALARMAGYDTPEELIEGVADLSKQVYVNPEDRVRYTKLLEEKGIVKGFEAQYYRKDGSIVWVSINAHTARDRTGKMLHYEGTVEDITDRKSADEVFRQNTDKLRQFLVGTIKAISMMVETRDPYTAGHQRRVSTLARAIAQDMGLPKDTTDSVRTAGVIHDLGKISLPAEILSKPGTLTDIEMSLIQVHPQSGYDILKDLGLPYPIAEMVLQHHERLDGSGYPQGLKNGQILLESQIIAVADVVESMASHRPYRPALGIDIALGEIEKNKGVLYNAQVVEACVKLFREKGFNFEA
jgi:PAS domain S-box-containing protein